jgi:hypothetical protein
MQDFFKNDYRNFFLVFIFNFIRHFFTTGEPNVTASASLQGACGERPQLRTLCLASAATSPRE